MTLFHSFSPQIANDYCVDLDSVHQSGVSNGGMFSYFIASRWFHALSLDHLILEPTALPPSLLWLELRL